MKKYLPHVAVALFVLAAVALTQGFAYAKQDKAPKEDKSQEIAIADAERRCNNPTIIVKGNATTTVGTPGDDVIKGSNQDDAIYGMGGNDTICGRGGDDLMYGGEGDDIISGGNGSDNLQGGLGRDKLYGQAGPDLLSSITYGDTDPDQVEDGGRGEDFCSGESTINTWINCEFVE